MLVNSKPDQRLETEPASLPVSRRIVKPTGCILAFGIPTTRAGFDRAAASPQADYATRELGGWPQYHANFVRDLEAVEPVFRRLGVTLVRDLTLDSFAQLFHRPFQVLILFSHWSEDAVEFADQLAPIPSVVSAVPASFDRILDLCVCHPDPLVVALHRHCPDCLLRYLPGKQAEPHFWIHFYRTLFLHLDTCDTFYPEAIQNVACAFLDRARSSYR